MDSDDEIIEITNDGYPLMAWCFACGKEYAITTMKMDKLCPECHDRLMALLYPENEENTENEETE